MNFLLLVATVIGAACAIGGCVFPNSPASPFLVTWGVVVMFAAFTWLVLRWIDDPTCRR